MRVRIRWVFSSNLMLGNVHMDMDGKFLVLILKACSSLEEVCERNQIHALLITNGYSRLNNAIFSSALTDFYVECGDLPVARKVFDQTMPKNVIIWTTWIVGYAQDSLLKEALDLFRQFWSFGIQID